MNIIKVISNTLSKQLHRVYLLNKYSRRIDLLSLFHHS